MSVDPTESRFDALEGFLKKNLVIPDKWRRCVTQPVV